MSQPYTYTDGRRSILKCSPISSPPPDEKEALVTTFTPMGHDKRQVSNTPIDMTYRSRIDTNHTYEDAPILRHAHNAGHNEKHDDIASADDTAKQFSTMTNSLYESHVQSHDV